MLSFNPYKKGRAQLAPTGNSLFEVVAALREQIFAMKPTEVLPKTFELGRDLLHPSDTLATKRREWVEDRVEFTTQLEMAHYARELAEDAFKDGTITEADAEVFIEEVSGLDVDVEATDK